MIDEPLCGAHTDPEEVAVQLKKTLVKYINELAKMDPETLLQSRYNKFRAIGAYIDRQKEQLDEKS